MNRIYTIFGAVLMMASASLSAQEAPASPVRLEIEAQKVVTIVDADGTRRTELAPMERILPGETIQYTIRYSNSGERPADNVVINNPVPDLMIYLFGSAEGEGTEIEFSVDGQTFGLPDQLTALLPSGETRRAEPEEYRAVRWRLLEPIPPGGSGFVRYRAVLQQ